MIKIAAHIPNPHDATNWYRGTGPLAGLRKACKDISIEMIKEWSFASVQMCDIAFFQRPSSKGELEAIRICKRLNIPVIVDYDDLLFDLPTDNPAYRLYMNKETQETIISIMREATCVWVSTKQLKRSIQIKGHSLNKNVYVIPNALDTFHLLFGDRCDQQKKTRNAVIWRGSPTHERDIMEYGGEILEVAKDHPKKAFVFVGYNPWFITDRMHQTQGIVTGAMPVGEFMDFIYNTGSEIGIVPLHDSNFNRCKSNIAWLEMVWSGGVVLAPDWEEWRMPGVVTYKDAKSFKEGLDWLCSRDSAELKQLNIASFNHIKEHFMLDRVNRIRAEIIFHLAGIHSYREKPDGWQELEEPEESVMELE